MSGSLESRVERRFLEIEERLRESELKNAEQLKQKLDAIRNLKSKMAENIKDEEDAVRTYNEQVNLAKAAGIAHMEYKIKTMR